MKTLLLKLKAWLQASRLPSQSYIFLGILLGHAVSYRLTGELNLPLAIVLHLYGLFLQLYIVYANDLADYETDMANKTFTPFSGGSRVLINGVLSRRELGIGVVIVITLNIVTGVYLTVSNGLILSLPFILLSHLLLWTYSFPPVKLSYRGGGEFLQMLGVGIVLPVFSFYAQTASLSFFPWSLLTVLIPVQLACAMSTSLPDQPSDALSKKKTIAVSLGLKQAALMVFLLELISIAALHHWHALYIGPLTVIKKAYFTCCVLLTASLYLLSKNLTAGTKTMLAFVFLSLLIVFAVMIFLILNFFSLLN